MSGPMKPAARRRRNLILFLLLALAAAGSYGLAILRLGQLLHPS